MTLEAEKKRNDAVSGVLEHLLVSAAQAGIEVPAKLEQSIRELHGECVRQAKDGDDERLVIAVAGKFSCGKSQFINSLIGYNLAPVDSMRTTCCKTTFTGDSASKRVRVVETATGKEISRREYRKRAAKRAATENDFSIFLPGGKWKDVVLVDTPGFDPPAEGDKESGVTTDAQISREAVRQADVVFFLMDMNDGTLTADSKDYLAKEISQTKSLLYIVLNKADEKCPRARRTIMDSVGAICREIGIRVEGAMAYCSLTAKSPELKNKSENGRADTLKLAGELRGNVWNCIVTLVQRKDQILRGRHKGEQVALTARLNKTVRDAAAYFKRELRRAMACDEEFDQVDVNDIIDAVADVFADQAADYLDRHAPVFKPVEVSGTGFWGSFKRNWVLFLDKPPEGYLPRRFKTGPLEKALRDTLQEFHEGFSGVESKLAAVFKTAFQEEMQTVRWDHEYSIRCERERDIPSAREQLVSKICMEFPDRIGAKCRLGVGDVLGRAWECHRRILQREREKKTRPLESDIEYLTTALKGERK